MVRQIGFSNFERRLHGMDADYRAWASPAKLSVEKLDAIWLKTAQELYGDEGEIFTYENTNHLWAYISHFHSPVLRLCICFRRTAYAESLRAAWDAWARNSSRSIWICCAPARPRMWWNCSSRSGWIPMSDDFWADGIRASLGALIAEAEELSQRMGVM